MLLHMMMCVRMPFNMMLRLLQHDNSLGMVRRKPRCTVGC
jgi:hypothetical protein